MSGTAYPPPTNTNLPVFNPDNYPQGTESVTSGDLSNYVTLSTAQNISGLKVYSNGLEASYLLNGSADTINMPSTAGTFALLSDITAGNFVTTDSTSQNITGTKTFDSVAANSNPVVVAQLGMEIQNPADGTAKTLFRCQNAAGITTTLSSIGTMNQTLYLPTPAYSSDVILSALNPASIQNKYFYTSGLNYFINNAADAYLKLNLESLTSGKTLTLYSGAQTVDSSLTFPVSSSDTLVALSTIQTMSNKSLIFGGSNPCYFIDDTNAARRVSLDLIGMGAIDVSLQFLNTATNTITFPSLTTTLIGTLGSATVLSKTLQCGATSPCFFADSADSTKQLKFNLAGNTTGAITTLSFSSTSPTTITVPNGQLANTTSAQTLTNKALSDTTTTIINVSDATKVIKFDASGSLTGTTLTLASTCSTNKTITFPNVTDTVVLATNTTTLTNKALSDTTTTIVNVSDATKKLAFSTASSTTATTATIATANSTSKTYTIPNASTNTNFVVTDPSSSQTINSQVNFASQLQSTYIKSNTSALTITSTFYTYGDSITANAGLNTNQGWPYYINLTLGKTLSNQAVSGYFTNDVGTKIYNTQAGIDASTIIFVGTNDVRKQLEPNITTDPNMMMQQSLQTLEQSAVFCALFAANKVDARSATETGSNWSNTSVYTTIGRTNTGAALPVTSYTTVTGRYVGVVITGTTPTHSSTYFGEPFDVDITNFVTDADGTNATFTQTGIKPAYNMVSAVVAGWSQFIFLFDTGVNAGSHTITVTWTTKISDNLYIDYYFGFDNTTGGNNTLVCSIPRWNYRMDYSGDNAAAYQDEDRRIAYNAGMKNMCRTWKNVFGLPIYFVDLDSYPYMLQSDGLHPTWGGQRWIGDKVLEVINNGNVLYI